jgi:CheY-like chemotaxis protein
MARTVLIVDDDEDIRDILRMHCELSGYEVVAEAADGLQGYLLASRYRPALVFLDYKMPEMNGEEASTLIRAELPKTTIVAFTGQLDEKPGWADDFLSKDDVRKVSPLLARFLEIPGDPA